MQNYVYQLKKEHEENINIIFEIYLKDAQAD